MEVKKLSQEEIDKLNKFRQTENYLVQNLGDLEIKIILINQQKENLKSQTISLQQEQNEYAKQLQEKYGEGSINIETGDFIPS